MEKKWLSPRNVALICDVKVITVYRWIRAGKLTAYRLGKQYRVSPDDLDAFIRTTAE